MDLLTSLMHAPVDKDVSTGHFPPPSAEPAPSEVSSGPQVQDTKRPRMHAEGRKDSLPDPWANFQSGAAGSQAPPLLQAVPLATPRAPPTDQTEVEDRGLELNPDFLDFAIRHFNVLLLATQEVVSEFTGPHRVHGKWKDTQCVFPPGLAVRTLTQGGSLATFLREAGENRVTEDQGILMVVTLSWADRKQASKQASRPASQPASQQAGKARKQADKQASKANTASKTASSQASKQAAKQASKASKKASKARQQARTQAANQNKQPAGQEAQKSHKH